MTDLQCYDEAMRHALLAKKELEQAMNFAAVIQGPLKERVYADLCKVFPSEGIERVRKPKGMRNATENQTGAGKEESKG